MSMDRKSDGATWRMNLKTFRDHFPDLVDMVQLWEIGFPGIVFINETSQV